MRNSIVAATVLVATVSAHGNVTSPPARLPGAGMAQACGQAAVSTVLADGTIPLENLVGVPATCQLDLCRGAVFEDNVALVQQFALGQVINFNAILPIPHEGPANISIVKTATNQVLGQPLLVFDSYADENLASLPANNTNFDVTIPTTLAATDCAVAGECVLQWFWFGTAAKQTYESCVDFVIAPAGAAAVGTAAGFARDTSFGGVVGSVSDISSKNGGTQSGAFGGVVSSAPSDVNTVSNANSVSQEGSFGGVVGAVKSISARRRRSL